MCFRYDYKNWTSKRERDSEKKMKYVNGWVWCALQSGSNEKGVDDLQKFALT